MKFFRPFIFSALAAVLVGPLAAQSKPAVAVVQPARIAFINSGAFLDENTGIKQLVRASQNLDLEFSTTQSELSLLNEKLRTLVGELTKLNTDAIANAKAIADKQAAGQKLQQELAAKQQAAQEAYNKRAQEVQGPITSEIAKELRAFAKERDLSALLDVAKLGESLIDFKPELDLTAGFIAYYNSRHQ